MHKLTYMNEKGYPVTLVFDSHKEAEKWGVIYSCRNGGTTWNIT
jgi:hypothetical protein